jgi:hypothetical protein
MYRAVQQLFKFRIRGAVTMLLKEILMNEI